MPDVLVVVGGVQCQPAAVTGALDVLHQSPGIMIRQPLQRAGNPLAWCNYHAVAAPYRGAFSGGAVTGRGAAGRHIAKQAFCLALEHVVERIAALAPVQALVAQAWAAFGRDSAYAAELASAATAVLAARHKEALRTRLQQAAHQAVSECDARRGEFSCSTATPCGTGPCPFAPPGLAFIETISTRGSGRRPANHVSAGTAYSVLDALPELAAAEPFALQRGGASA